MCLLVTGQPFVPLPELHALRTLALPSGYGGRAWVCIDYMTGCVSWTNNTSVAAVEYPPDDPSGPLSPALERTEAGERMADRR